MSEEEKEEAPIEEEPSEEEKREEPVEEISVEKKPWWKFWQVSARNLQAVMRVYARRKGVNLRPFSQHS